MLTQVAAELELEVAAGLVIALAALIMATSFTRVVKEAVITSIAMAIKPMSPLVSVVAKYLKQFEGYEW